VYKTNSGFVREGPVQIQVYRYFVVAEHLGREVSLRPRRRGTLLAIRAIGGVPLMSTETLADDSALDPNGFTAETETAD
jgi:hypothetical protein